VNLKVHMQDASSLLSARALLRRQHVEALTGLARSTIYKLLQTGDFPAPVRLTAKSVAWRSEDVSAWIDARVSTSAAA
jgi:prophage regulatory protein